MAKKIGIVCDNYKLNKFKKELKANGFKKITTKPFTVVTTSIFVKVEDQDLEKVKKVVDGVEVYFKALKN